MPSLVITRDTVSVRLQSDRLEPIRYDPAKEVFRNMLRLVAYDVANARRLRKVSEVCKDYGLRIEYSVFECDLEEQVFQTFWSRLLELIDPEEDRLISYRICAGCVADIRSAGVVERPRKVLLYII